MGIGDLFSEDEAMSEQWEVMWWAGSRLGGERASPAAPVRTPEGWEPFGSTGDGFWLRRRVPTQTYITGAQQSHLNEYPVPPWCRRTE